MRHSEKVTAHAHAHACASEVQGRKRKQCKKKDHGKRQTSRVDTKTTFNAIQQSCCRPLRPLSLDTQTHAPGHIKGVKRASHKQHSQTKVEKVCVCERESDSEKGRAHKIKRQTQTQTVCCLQSRQEYGAHCA